MISPPKIDLGIAGWRVPLHSHIACFWETEKDLAEALGFLDIGLRGSDPCVLIGGPQDIERMLDILASRGLDVEDLRARKRLTILERAPTAKGMLDEVSAALETVLAGDPSLVRLSGIVGWGRQAGPPDAELYSYEARLTEMAERLPCVILCLHEVKATTGPILRHGVLGTHPLTLCDASLSANPLVVPFERIAGGLSAVEAELSSQQGERNATRRESEILRAIFENAPVMISFYDAEGRLLFVNREWERVLGWSLEEARNMEVLRKAYPDPERHREVIEFMGKAERRWQDFRTETKDGRVIDTSWLRVAVSDGTRIGFGLDLTERKWAEEYSRQVAQKIQTLSAQKEDHLRLVIDTIPSMAWSLQPGGAVDFVNQRWIEFTGLSLEEALENATRVVHPDDLPWVMERWVVDNAARQPSEYEMRLRRADGEYRWFLVRTVPLRDEQGNIVKWYGTSTDIEDRKRAEEELKATSDQLRALSARLRSAREEESTRIAREVHDEIGQALTALQLDVAWLGKRLDASVPPKPETLSAKLRSMSELIDETIGAVHRIATDLRPGVLDELGLEAAVEWHVREFENRTGIACRLHSDLNGAHLDPKRATAIFRILQEALTNVARHSGSTRVDIHLTTDADRLRLEVEDDGRGFPQDQMEVRQSLGLLGMRERARSLGGDLSIGRVSPSGTSVTLTVPR